MLLQDCLHNGEWHLEEVVSNGVLWRHVICGRCEVELYEKALEPDKTAAQPSRVTYSVMKSK
jgi:hypothetical protein